MPLGLDRFAQLAVERLDRVRRVDHAADFGRERQKRGDVFSAVEPRLGNHREPAAPFLVESLEFFLCGV